MRKLSDGIGLLERQLRHEVVLRHSELLQQLVSLRDTEAVLAVVRAGADSLQASVQVGAIIVRGSRGFGAPACQPASCLVQPIYAIAGYQFMQSI